MSNTNEIETIDRKIEHLTELLDHPVQNYEAIVKKIWTLEKKKISLSILSDDGLEFSPINQFNSESYGVYADITVNNQRVDSKCNFETFVVTKYHQKFRDCDYCGKSKDKIEIQVFMPSCGQHLCLDCFDREMREEYLNDNCDFEIIEMHKDISESIYSFSYNDFSISFDKFSYYSNTHEENMYTIFFYQEINGGIRRIGELTRFNLTKQELNFLKTQYNLEDMEQLETEGYDDET